MPKIEALYAWICTEPDGGEGIPAVHIGNTPYPMPLIGADGSRIESLRPYALAAARELGLPVRLVRFDTMTVLEELPAKPGVTPRTARP